MSARGLRIIIAAMWLVWTGAIIPGHTRGAIPVAGSESTKSCCEQPSKPEKKTPAKRSHNCAVCAVAAKLTNGPGISLAPTRFTLLAINPPPVADRTEVASIVLPRQCRDPPAW
jgi:hypothetical protein